LRRIRVFVPNPSPTGVSVSKGAVRSVTMMSNVVPAALPATATAPRPSPRAGRMPSLVLRDMVSKRVGCRARMVPLPHMRKAGRSRDRYVEKEKSRRCLWRDGKMSTVIDKAI
jgi:hypothetical protein